MNYKIQKAKDNIASVQEQCHFIDGDEKKYFKESIFAMQALESNSYLLTQAENNPESLKNAIINLSSMGLSLNPSKKQAYLVPYKGSVDLQISYMGLIDLAINDGAILWAKSDVVRESDTFVITGIDTQPNHQYRPFASKLERGNVVGVYCIAKVPNGDYITDIMSIDDINDIKKRSVSLKLGNTSPWKTDFNEMAKKTVIKRASKYWKGSIKLGKAVDYLNSNMNEGIEFNKKEGGVKIAEYIASSNTRNAYLSNIKQEDKQVQAEVIKEPTKSLKKELNSLMEEHGISTDKEKISFAKFNDIVGSDESTFTDILHNFDKYFDTWKKALKNEK